MSVSVWNVTKKYDSFTALENISFTLSKGSCLYVSGKNGAGKTTLLEIICGLKRPNQGKIKLNGIPVCDEPEKALRGVGALFDDSFLYGDLTLLENLQFFARLCGISKSREQIRTFLEEFDLEDKVDILVKHLSCGQERMASIARVLLGEPGLLILDEPTSGLDRTVQEKVIEYLEGLVDAGRTILISSHDSSVVRGLANFVAFLEDGKLAFYGDGKSGFEFIREKNLGS